MAHYATKTSLVAFLVVLAVANADKKLQPEWLIDHHDGSVLIPGIGRYLPPPLLGRHGLKHHKPIMGTYAPGGGGSSSSSSSGNGAQPPRSYVPGGDDTFVPNPGFEVPNPIP